MKDGEIKLFNSFIDIDGQSEIGETVLNCNSIFLKGSFWSKERKKGELFREAEFIIFRLRS